jgi:hypothetical protein
LIALHGLKADRDIEGYDGMQKKYFDVYVLLPWLSTPPIDDLKT